MGLGFEGTHAAQTKDQTSCQPVWLEYRQVACAAFGRWRRGRRVVSLTLKPGDAPSPARPSHAEKQELRRPERGMVAWSRCCRGLRRAGSRPAPGPPGTASWGPLLPAWRSLLPWLDEATVCRISQGRSPRSAPGTLTARTE
jgi:hypothetical protein